MANSPKKSAAAAVSMRAMERAIETAAVVEPVPTILEAAPEVFEPEPAPVVEAAPLVVAATPAPLTPIPEAPIASLSQAQSKMQEMVETGLSETHSKYEKMKSAAGEAAHAMEASYATVKHGAVQFNVKVLDALSESAHANFDFFKSMFAVKSPSEYVTLQTEFARKQIELMTAQTKAFGELAQKVAAETVEPIKAQVVKTFNIH